jgi:hypothetical protein
VTGSFLTVLEAADDSLEYYAFADQDDVWYPRKLANAVEALRSAPDPGVPLLYCSRLELVDERLRHLAVSRPLRDISFRNALFQNVLAGCTMVMNARARELVLRGGVARNILMHDWWCYLAISAFGRILYDERAGIKYRQHDHNQVGARVRWSERIRWRFKRTLHGLYGHFPSEQNDLFLKIYGEDLPETERRFAEMTLEAKRSLLKRVILASSNHIRMQSPVDNFFARVGILINKF